jgi:hypothetical protein
LIKWQNNMNNYMGDTRYEKVWEQMQLLGIEDVTSKRQAKNGTRVWQLPIRVHTCPSITKFIEVASFKTGYVRNQNSGYSNYQLNKRVENQPTYFKDYKWVTKNDGNGDYGKSEWTGKYQKFTTRGCKLIPIEIDRLEYLISYCIKNYYIKNANQVANGEYVPKWMYDDGQRYDDDKIQDLEEKLENMTEARDCYKDKLEESDYRIKDLERMLDGYKTREKDLENKLDTIKRIADHG